MIGAETGSCAKEAGSLLPTLFFGVPGSSGMAIMLGAFLMLGIQPGPTMLTEHINIVWSLIWALVIANVICVIMLIAAGPWIGKLGSVKASFLIPYVLVFALLGCYLFRGNWQNLILVLVMGSLGYLFKRHDWPRAPFIIGVILGKIAEDSLLKAIGICGAELLLAADLAGADRADHRQHRLLYVAVAQTCESVPEPCLRDVFSSAASWWWCSPPPSVLSFTYAPEARFLPLVIGIPGLLLVGCATRQGAARTARTVVIIPEERRREAQHVRLVHRLRRRAGAVRLSLCRARRWLRLIYIFRAARDGTSRWRRPFVAWAILYGVFERFLGLPLFEGLVVQWIFG